MSPSQATYTDRGWAASLGGHLERGGGGLPKVKEVGQPWSAGGIPFWEPLDIGDLARAMNVRRAGKLEDWAISIWESEEELKEFISDIYSSRRTG